MSTDEEGGSSRPHPARARAVIRFVSLVLSLSSCQTVTYSNVAQVKAQIQNLIDKDNLSPRQIRDLYKFEYSDFGMFLKKCLDINLKPSRDAAINYYIQQGRHITDAKALYWQACQFKFDPATQPNIAGYGLLKDAGFCFKGLNRDHMLSITYGWVNNIDPSIVSHPANCEIMQAADNSKKYTASSLVLEDLQSRIRTWDCDSSLVASERKRIVLSQPKSDDHKRRIADAVRNQRIYTDGVRNIKQDKDLIVPAGFWPGMTRKKRARL